MLEQVRGYADRHIDIYYLAPPRWGFVLTLAYYESRMYYFKTLCEVLGCANITTKQGNQWLPSVLLSTKTGKDQGIHQWDPVNTNQMQTLLC